MRGENEVKHEYCRQRYNDELMQLFGGSDILSFIRIGLVMLIERIGKRKVRKVFNNNHQGNRLKARPNSRWWNCVQTERQTDGQT